jgi:hypothetical protein
MMEDIIHCHGNLFADLLEEFYVRLTVGPLLHARESHGSQPSQRRCQGNDTDGIDAVLLHALGNLRPAMFFGKIRNEEGLLRLPDQSDWSLFNGLLMATHDVGRNISLKRV